MVKQLFSKIQLGLRKSPLLLVVPLLLSACSDGSNQEARCEQQFWNGSVGICLPAGWKMMERERLDEIGIPADTVAVFESEEQTAGQASRVTITGEALSSAMDSAAYSRASVQAVSALPGYQIIDTSTVRIEGNDVDLHKFTAQPLVDKPKRRFYQVSAVTGSTGYTVTGVTPLAPPDSLEGEILLMLRSLRFTDPGSQ